MKKPKVIILKGLPGSGKSTWAKEMAKRPDYKRVNKDDIRQMLDSGMWSKENEADVISVRDWLIGFFVNQGKNVIVDDTNLHPKHETQIRKAFEDVAEIEINADFLDVPLEQCIANDLKRPTSVGEKVIRTMYRQFVQKKPAPPLFQEGKPYAIICDIDGTLAHMKDRSAYDWKAVGNDTKDDLIHNLVAIARTNMLSDLILVSGRDEVCRPETEAWLKEHGITYHGLFMRPQGDKRKYNVVKEEIYQNHIAGHYNVRFVLDDRDQVVRMWRDLGLVCFQVADGDF